MDLLLLEGVPLDHTTPTPSAFGEPVGPDDLRSRENEEITERFAKQLEARGHRSPFSPDFLNSLPRSALERYRITPEQEEEILYLYAATYSLHQTARSAGLSLDKVRAVVYSPSATPKIQAYRDQLRVSVLQKIEEAQVVLLDAVQDPDKLKAASITQISDVFTDISTTQGNLLTSLREASVGSTISDPTEVFDGEDLEYIALLRRRLSIGQRPRSLNFSTDDPPGDFLETHFVEGSSVNLDPNDPLDPEEVLTMDDRADVYSHDHPGPLSDDLSDVYSHDNPGPLVDEQVDIVEYYEPADVEDSPDPQTPDSDIPSEDEE